MARPTLNVTVEARIAAGVGGERPRAQESLPLAMTTWVGGIRGKKLELEEGIGRAVQRAGDRVLDPSVATVARTGKFWRLLLPVSVSRGSLAVTPLLSRSIPSEPLA